MTTCSRCDRRGENVAHFSNGDMEIMCPEHHNEHLREALRSKRVAEAERRAHHYRQAYAKAGADFDRALRELDAAKRR